MIIVAFVITPISITLLWLFSIRPYGRPHGKGLTPGATIAATFWVDWQEAREIAKQKGDGGMILICRIVRWLQILPFAILAHAIIRARPQLQPRLSDHAREHRPAEDRPFIPCRHLAIITLTGAEAFGDFLDHVVEHRDGGE